MIGKIRLQERQAFIMKRIVTIQDISCVGKCSLTVALPVISAMGVETAVIPSAVLSNHTAFENFSFRDMSDEIRSVSEQWKKQGMKFDAIYTGYLGSARQVGLVCDFLDDFADKDNCVIVDPAMADNGKLYKGFDSSFSEGMKKLVSQADVIIPNLTEAALLAGVDYPSDGYDEAYVQDLLRRLVSLGCSGAVITGISYDAGKLGAASFDAATDTYYSCFDRKSSRSFHGTGDIFASVVTGSLVNGMSLKEAIKNAVAFTLQCIDETEKDPDARWYGVDFETALPKLIMQMNEWRKHNG